MPELLSEDLPSWRPWYLVGEEHLPDFLVWSNLPEENKNKGLKCEKHDIDSSSNINSNIIKHMYVLSKEEPAQQHNRPRASEKVHFQPS